MPKKGNKKIPLAISEYYSKVLLLPSIPTFPGLNQEKWKEFTDYHSKYMPVYEAKKAVE